MKHLGICLFFLIIGCGLGFKKNDQSDVCNTYFGACNSLGTDNITATRNGNVSNDPNGNVSTGNTTSSIACKKVGGNGVESCMETKNAELCTATNRTVVPNCDAFKSFYKCFLYLSVKGQTLTGNLYADGLDSAVCAEINRQLAEAAKQQ